MNKRRDAYPSERRKDYLAIGDIESTPMPGRYFRSTNYDPYEDRAPVGKWTGILAGTSGDHLITILAHQHNAGDAPYWTVRATFDSNLFGTEMEVKWKTKTGVIPREFVKRLPEIESSILRLEASHDTGTDQSNRSDPSVLTGAVGKGVESD